MVFSSICWCGILHWLICWYWKGLASLREIPLDHDVWSFQCIAGFGLLVFCWSFASMFISDIGDGCKTLEYTKNYGIVHFKWVNCMVYDLKKFF